MTFRGTGFHAVGLLAMAAVASAQTDKYAFYGLGPDGKPVVTTSVHTAGPMGRLFAGAEEAKPLEQRVKDRLANVVALPGHPVFPEGTRLQSVEVDEGGVVQIRADLPESWLEALRTGATGIDQITHHLDDHLIDLPINGVMVRALDRASGEYLPLDVHVPVDNTQADHSPDTASPVASAVKGGPVTMSNYPRPSGGRPTGGLSGRVVYLNQGHGWTWRSGTTWGLQRGFLFNNIEDMSNADTVNGWVWPYLYRAGAEVFTCREMDPNPNMVIVDNDDANADYVETGSWSTSSVTGFRNGQFPYVQGQNPFSFGTQRLVQCVVGPPTASATYIPTIPQAGFYNVYVSHAAFSNRSPQAHYRITHAGGDTDYYVDQRRWRNTWIFIGRYYFEAGRDPSRAKVVLFNDSTSTSHFVSTDAVRFGGGRGIISRNNSTSPHPNHDNEAIYHLQFMGAPTSVYQSSGNDEATGWNGRPRFGRWLEQTSVAYGAPPLPSVFISNHTNAANGTARGPISYVYTGEETSIHGTFRTTVHNRVQTNWGLGYGGNYVPNSNPLRSGQYGENNPANVNQTGYQTVPIFLGEWLFHDNASDMALYHDPKFRRMLGRGIYQGIVDHFAANNGGNATYLPEPPRNLRVVTNSPTQATLTWTAPLSGRSTGLGDAATGYKVYQSTHGRGFADGIANVGTSIVLNGLTPGQTYYFQVTATNAGGESFPTETLACKMPVDGTTPKLLVVNGFDKLDLTMRVQTSYNGDVLYRQFVDQMNTMDYIVEHGRAIDASGHAVAFDAVEHDVVEANLVTLGNYAAVIWIGGLQSEVSTADPGDDTAMKSNTRSALTNYLNAGGKLFVSGGEVAWDLNRLGQTTFLANTLRTAYVTEGPQSAAEGTPGSIFDGIGPLTFGQGSGSPYRVYFPDTLNTAGGSVSAMVYGSASGAISLDSFDSIGGWQAPSFSGQTTADSSTFGIASSPVRQGTGSGNLGYNWTLGSFIREYNASLPAFPAASNFGIWVHGDNSGHQVRICLRDSDNELYVNTWTTINFNGWQKITWNDIINNPGTRWAGSGNNIIDGPNVRFDSIHIQQVAGGPTTGNIYFDDATYTPTSGGGNPIAAIQFSGTSKVVVMGFPFETITDANTRTAVMDRVLDFFFAPPGSDGMMVY